MLKRSDLLDVLNRTAPGLSGKDLIPVLSCFCFDGKSVTTHDDVVALRIPLDFPVRGALKGKLLLDMLSASRSQDVNVEQSRQEVTVKCGRSKLTTSALPEEDFIFAFPEDKGAASIPLSGKFIKALRRSMLSMGVDPSRPWMQGVTVSIKGGKATFYSSDNKRATRIRCSKIGKGVEDMVIVLPPRFCILLADISGRDDAKSMTVGDGFVVASFGSGLQLFSKLIGEYDVGSYVKLFKMASEVEGALREVPKGLDRALDRALVVIPYAKDPFTSLSVSKGKLVMETVSTAGNVRDSLALEDHPAVEVQLDPALFREALNHSTRFRIIPPAGSKFPGCIHLEGEDMIHMVTLIRPGNVDESDDKE